MTPPITRPLRPWRVTTSGGVATLMAATLPEAIRAAMELVPGRLITCLQDHEWR